jgi:hypothetical protein
MVPLHTWLRANRFRSAALLVAFSISELVEGMENLKVLIADTEDDKPLAQTAGLLRLVVPEEKRPARWVRMVKSIRVVARP